ncbi:MAG: dimethyl sulfoxide reductase anchor subunit [Deltaproteobacteria bacterium]|nr:dimethyl sulfoxide reductase anchor subunit [Deltaproteobacteria bacterium]
MRTEGSLIAFTLLLEWGVGTFLLARIALPLDGGAGEVIALAGGAGSAVALGLSLLHLGVPSRAFLALRSWRTSPLSREIACALLFLIAWGAWAVASPRWLGNAAWLPARELVGWIAAVLGLATVASVGAVYKATCLDGWSRSFTLVAHVATALLLGATTVAAVAALFCPEAPGLRLILWLAAAAEAVLLAGLPSAVHSLRSGAPMRRWTGARMPPTWIPALATRTALLLVASALTLWMLIGTEPTRASAAIALGVVSIATELFGRWLFYSTAVPRLP